MVLLDSLVGHDIYKHRFIISSDLLFLSDGCLVEVYQT